MKKDSPKYNKAYSSLSDYSKKYTPHKWLKKVGFKNIDRQQLVFVFSRLGFSLLVSLSALFTSYVFKFYPDKTPFFMIYLVFVAMSAWYGGLKSGVFTASIIAIGAFFLLRSVNEWYVLSFGLFLQLGSFMAGSVFISFLINRVWQTIEIKNLKRKEKVYAQTFTALHDTYKKALEEIKARDEFLSLVSHELKTPLTTMLLKLDSMLASIREVSLAKFSVPELMRVLKNAEEQIKWLTATINDLQNISLIRTGQMRLNREDTDLTQITRHVMQNFSELLKREKYKINIEAKAPIIGRWDKIRIEQAITNLFSNAIKYGDGKPIDIKILNSGRVGKFIIQDRGVGIPSQDQKAIFDLFQRATRSSDGGHGLGVGLYVTSQIVRLHGGTIKVSSVPMKGSKFTIELPLIKAKA